MPYKSRNEELQTELDSTKTLYIELQSKHSAFMSNISTSTTSEESKDLKCQVDKAQKEIERLQVHLIESEDQHTLEVVRQDEVLKEFQRQVEALSREKDVVLELLETTRAEHVREKQEFIDKVEQYEDLVDELRQVQGKSSVYEESSKKLEAVLEEFQRSKEVEIHAMREAYDEAIRELKERLVIATKKCEKLEVCFM